MPSIRSPFRVSVALTAAFLAAAIPAAAGGKAPVLVELYTSQGCSSCPPADRFLGELQKRDDLVTLSFNIDYWDYIGWRDTLATHENTLRQKAYEKTLPSRRRYTPQIVVDGVADVAGNRTGEVQALISKRHADAAGKKVPIALSSAGGTIRVEIGAAPSHPAKPATIWAARTIAASTVAILSGENEGRTVTYYNVVRDYAAVGEWSGAAMNLTLPAKTVPGAMTDGIAVWIQEDGHGAVLGAANLQTGK